MRGRLIQILKNAISIALIGVAYAFLCQKAGISVPCMFHEMTGLKCPACGVTHMCLALMRLDFQTAYESNRMLFLLSPLIAAVIFKYVLDYIRTGRWKMGKVQNVMLYICVALMVLFGIYRNCTFHG